MRPLSIILFLIIGIEHIYAETILIGTDIGLYLPEKFLEESANNGDFTFFCIDHDRSNYLYIQTLPNKGFKGRNLVNELDAIFYNVSEMKLVKKEKEKLWDFTADYCKKYYEINKEKMFVTYSFYTSQTICSISFFYDSIDELNTFDEIIDSIDLYEAHGLKQIRLTEMYSYKMWLLLAVLLSMFSVRRINSYHRGKNCLLLTLFMALVLLIPLWNFWLAYVVAVIGVFLWSYLCSYAGIYIGPDI